MIERHYSTRELAELLAVNPETIRREAARGRLRSTLVACMGEFGRTPSINANDGRDHWPGAWSAALAGGGIRGGVVRGATDEDGAKVATANNPVAAGREVGLPVL